jgi:hypothetical protein
MIYDDDIPFVPNIDSKILAAIEADPKAFDMDYWHSWVDSRGESHYVHSVSSLVPERSCGTAHCRAGWAIVLAGPEGMLLEQRLGPDEAGRLIYEKSRPGMEAPDFHARQDDALEDIRQCAALETPMVEASPLDLILGLG